MTALILDGRALAKTLREELRAETRAVIDDTGKTPTLAVVHVEGDAASERYVRSLRKLCADVGMGFINPNLPPHTTQVELERTVYEFSTDQAVSGVLLQLPLPAGLSIQGAVAQLDPRKDVDGVHPYNAGLLVQDRPHFVPNTPAGGIELLRRYGIEMEGKRATVVGRGIVVGQPMALLLLNQHATVTVCHSYTRDLAAAIREAEIVVSAAGHAGLITGEMLRPGAVVVDFGINVLADGRVVGDVDFASAVEVAAAITPVPGGTGPVTNMMLLKNVLLAAREMV